MEKIYAENCVIKACKNLIKLGMLTVLPPIPHPQNLINIHTLKQEQQQKCLKVIWWHETRHLIKVLKLRPVHWQILWNWKYCQCLLLWWTWSQADAFQSRTSQRWWCWLQNHLPQSSTFPMATLGMHQRLCGLKCPGAVKHLLSLPDWSQEWSSSSWLLL